MWLNCSPESEPLDSFLCVSIFFLLLRDIKRGGENEINIETEGQNERRNEEKDGHRSSPGGALPRQQGEALIS